MLLVQHQQIDYPLGTKYWLEVGQRENCYKTIYCYKTRTVWSDKRKKAHSDRMKQVWAYEKQT